MGVSVWGFLAFDGAVSVSAAADVARLPQAEQAEIVARGKHEILEVCVCRSGTLFVAVPSRMPGHPKLLTCDGCDGCDRFFSYRSRVRAHTRMRGNRKLRRIRRIRRNLLSSVHGRCNESVASPSRQ